jgi:HAMP domain-containing protein
MDLRTRIQLMVTSLLVGMVMLIAVLVILSSRRNILEQASSDGLLMTEQLARAASLGETIQKELYTIFAQQFVSSAVTTTGGLPNLDNLTGVRASVLEFAARRMNQDIWIGQFVDPAIGHGISAVWWVDGDFYIKLFRGDPAAGFSENLTVKDRQMLQKVMDEKQPLKFIDGKYVKSVAYTTDEAGNVTGAGMLAFPTSLTGRVIHEQTLLTALAVLVSLLIGLSLSAYLARRVTSPVAEISKAATAIENGTYETISLVQVSQRSDELGHLARVFQSMAQEVNLRELRLRQQVQELRIEVDNVKKSRQVEEITESEFFQDLKQKANTLRSSQKARRSERAKR